MLTDQISSDIKVAMKAQDAPRLSTLRLLKAALKNKQIEQMRELTDDEAMAVAKTQIKQLKDAADTFRQAGRVETAEANEREIAVLASYLPAPLDDDELARIVKDAVSASGASTKGDTGKAMGAAMKAVAGRADGQRVKAVVESLLAVFALFALFALTPESVSAATANADLVVSGARILRVFLMLMGVVSVIFIVMGAVSIMTATGRDHGHHHGLQQIAVGIFGTILMAGLIAIASATIMKLG